jgi:hypothetical protein
MEEALNLSSDRILNDDDDCHKLKVTIYTYINNQQKLLLSQK